jgi:hypothetical protein
MYVVRAVPNDKDDAETSEHDCVEFERHIPHPVVMRQRNPALIRHIRYPLDIFGKGPKNVGRRRDGRHRSPLRSANAAAEIQDPGR